MVLTGNPFLGPCSKKAHPCNLNVGLRRDVTFHKTVGLARRLLLLLAQAQLIAVMEVKKEEWRRS